MAIERISSKFIPLKINFKMGHGHEESLILKSDVDFISKKYSDYPPGLWEKIHRSRRIQWLKIVQMYFHCWVLFDFIFIYVP